MTAEVWGTGGSIKFTITMLLKRSSMLWRRRRRRRVMSVRRRQTRTPNRTGDGCLLSGDGLSITKHLLMMMRVLKNVKWFTHTYLHTKKGSLRKAASICQNWSKNPLLRIKVHVVVLYILYVKYLIKCENHSKSLQYFLPEPHSFGHRYIRRLCNILKF